MRRNIHSCGTRLYKYTEPSRITRHPTPMSPIHSMHVALFAFSHNSNDEELFPINILILPPIQELLHIILRLRGRSSLSNISIPSTEPQNPSNLPYSQYSAH